MDLSDPKFCELVRGKPKAGECNAIKGNQELSFIRCHLPEGHEGHHFGTCGWGSDSWAQEREPKRLLGKPVDAGEAQP